MRAAAWALLALLAAGVLVAGFPPASPEMRWAVGVSLAFGLIGLAGPGKGVALAAFASTVAGGAAVLMGSAPLCPWPALIALSFGTGFFFRRLALSAPPVSPDRASLALRPLVALWALASLAAAISARSVWAILHGLDLRVINSRGMVDAEALAGNLNSLASVLSGVVLYGVLLGMDSDSGRRALRGVLAGATASGMIAVSQALGWISAPRLPFWQMAGRLQGLSSDPNALGVLEGLAIPVVVAGAMWGFRRAGWWIAAFALAAGLAESGSRSGFLVALGGCAILIVLAMRRASGSVRRLRPAARIGFLAALLLLAVVLASHRRAGGLSHRLASIFDRDVPLEFRVSARPILWGGAWEAWLRNPIAGLGWNAFSWQLPNLSPAAGAAMRRYDNPGNFYVQVLTETGLAGAAIFLGFLAAAGRAVGRVLRDERKGPESGLPAGAAAALAAFAAALFFGSHLLAAEVSCMAFVCLAQFRASEATSGRIGRIARLAVVVAAAAWAASLSRSAGSDEAFRYSDGIGFYGAEKSPEGEFRWAGRRSAVRLAPGERRAIRAVFRSPTVGADAFRILWQGRVLYSNELERDRPVRLLLVGPSSRPAILFLENSRSFRPSAFGLSRDSRDLSIQVFAAP